ncbi:MAG: hypothetical protein J7J14_05600 [Thermotogaceae bacterium]|nr:hypothetical protein [Thermotogaceae bacterium]
MLAMEISEEGRKHLLYVQHGEGFGDHGKCKEDNIIFLALFSIPCTLFLKQSPENLEIFG